LIETTDVLDEAAVDPYAFVRETYLQVRKNKVYDGEPPIEEELLFEDEIQFEDELTPDK
jgi:phospholipid-binding lipoprotein MlaA